MEYHVSSCEWINQTALTKHWHLHTALQTCYVYETIIDVRKWLSNYVSTKPGKKPSIIVNISTNVQNIYFLEPLPLKYTN